MLAEAAHPWVAAKVAASMKARPHLHHRLLILVFSSKAAHPGVLVGHQRWRRTPQGMAHAASVSGPASSSWLHLLFVVGNPAHSEFESTPPNEGTVDGDVLRLDRTHDSYDDLSAKVLDAIRWAVVHWRFDYLFKADDDTYVCTRDVVELLDERFGASTDMGAPRPESASSRCTYIGEQIHGKRAWLRPGLPWYDPHYPTVFNTTIYPDFMQGGGYILSHGAARAVVDMGKEVGLYSWRREAERMPHQEDVLVAELLRRGTANASLRLPTFPTWGESMCQRVALRFTFSIQLSRGVKHVHSELPTRCGREQMWMHPVNLARIAAVERAA